MQQKTKMMIILIFYKKDVLCTDLLNLRTMKYDTQISLLVAKKITLFF